MTFMDLVKERYSVRKFSDRPVEREKLDAALAAGNAAPTAKNLQPQRIYVLLLAYDSNEDWKNPLEEGVHSGYEDVSIVATHIMLAAREQGLDTCWCNYFPNSQLEQTFGLPESEKSVLIMPIGYAAESAKPAPGHSQKKELSETVRFL